MEKRGNIEIPSTPFAFVWFSTKPYKKRFLWTTILVALATLFSSLQAYTFKGFVDAINNNSQSTLIFWWVLSYPILILLSQGAYRIAGFVSHPLAVSQRTRAVRELFKYLSLHSLSYFNDRFSGTLSSRVGTVSRGVSRITAQFIRNVLTLFIGGIITAIIIWSANHTLAIIFICGFVVLIPINFWLTRKQVVLSDKLEETSSRLSGQVVDSITNISAVQQYSRRTHEIERLDKVISEHKEADIKSDYYGEKVLVINNILIGVFIGVIVLGAFWYWREGLITIGSLVMIIALTRSFMGDLTNIGQNLNSIMEWYGELKSGLSEITKPHDITDKPNARRLDVKEKNVVFDNVTFAYEKDPRDVFKNLTFRVKSGEKVGIVGTSGAGKTTLMKLLLRQHDLIGGGISIDGQDIRDVTQESLRENVSIVPQEPMLFHRTIRENILYGKLNASDYEMIEVAKKAQAHDFIEQLPQKYDSLVGERGVKLSVGQRQRIAIARAFLKNAPILILDEATSALDSESEVAVQKALHALMEGKTVFAIAHRLSTLRDMDRILVFEDGKIVEDGTHRALLKNKEGVYASFWGHQAGGFIKE